MAKISTEQRKLNPRQKNAVEHGDGPLLIIAGAGTGKTTVITERIKYLISSGRAKPQEILALTFTEKAAREMEERTDVIMPYGYTQMWISTFHTFCDRLLRQEAIHIGINPAYRVMTDTDAMMLMRKHLFDFSLDYFRPLGNPTKFITGMLQHFSRLHDEDVTPEQYMQWSKKQNAEDKLERKKYRELARAYKKYQEIKIAEGFMDFGDLIAKCLELFRRRPNLLSTYQKQFRYILVDEYQDTNIAQNELVMLLAGKRANITVVADDDQSVYKWRGAAVSNVLQFRKTYPLTRLIALTINYRSTQAILDASYQLIQHNNPDRLEVREHIDKRLVSARKDSGIWPKLIYQNRVENEADAVAKKIKKIMSEQKTGNRTYDWKDFAILVRANNHADSFAAALSRHTVPYQFLGPGQLFRQPEIKDLISYLMVLEHIADSVALFRVLSMPYFDILPRDLAIVTAWARTYNLTLFEACEQVVGIEPPDERELPQISQKTVSTIFTIVTILRRHLGLLNKETAGQILFYFLSDTGMMKSILNYSAPMDEKIAENISRFFSKIKTYETDHAEADVSSVLEWINLSMELGESPKATDYDWFSNDAVNILTIHSAKGLEFPIVFLVNMVSQRFPTRERREQIPIPDDLIKEELPEGDYHMEEERRLCYVGMTRARDFLYLTGANYYGEGKREKKLSPFVYEVIGKTSVIAPDAQPKQISLLDWKSQEEQDTKESIKAPVVAVTYLSYSQIEAFRVCPLHYKLRYIHHIPTPATPALSFGVSMHETLRDFYALHARGEAVSQELLLGLLDKRWRTEGYDSKAYESKMRTRGISYLKHYFRHRYNPNTKIAALEQQFTVPIHALGRTIKIGGKIDRVDFSDDGTIHIIDYKTGRTPSTREIDANLQLSMYAIAACGIPNNPFGKKPEQVKLSMYYFDSDEEISTVRSAQILEKEKQTIIETAQQIEQSDFRCSGHLFCRDCEYSLFCNAS